MCLIVDNPDLLTLLKDIHTLTGADAAVLDADFREIISYPEGGNAFLRSLRACGDDEGCRKRGKASGSGIDGDSDSLVFSCPTGLRGATAPIRDATGLIGYLTAGPFVSRGSPIGEDEARRECRPSMAADSPEREFELLPRVTEEQSAAIAGIIRACASYISLKEFVKARRQSDFVRIRDYIDNNLSDDLSATSLCAALYISRNALFKLVRDETGMTLSQYVLKKRLNHAKRLLKTADVNILRISELCGIDFNYFSRLFKKEFGQSPREYRKSWA